MNVVLRNIAAGSYTSTRIRVQFWGGYDPTATGATPVFSNPLTTSAGAAAPLVFTTGVFNPTAPTNTNFTLTINGAITLPAGANLGVTVNWQGSTDGINFTDDDNLTTALRNPATSSAIAVGTNLTPDSGYYRNAGSETDFNFLASSARNLGAGPGGLVFSLTPVPEPATCLLAGSLALGGLGYARRRRTGRRAAAALGF